MQEIIDDSRTDPAEMNAWVDELHEPILATLQYWTSSPVIRHPTFMDVIKRQLRWSLGSTHYAPETRSVRDGKETTESHHHELNPWMTEVQDSPLFLALMEEQVSNSDTRLLCHRLANIITYFLMVYSDDALDQKGPTPICADGACIMCFEPTRETATFCTHLCCPSCFEKWRNEQERLAITTGRRDGLTWGCPNKCTIEHVKARCGGHVRHVSNQPPQRGAEC